MQPTLEIESFISSIVALPAGPGVSLDEALKPCLEDEAELRKLFATDRENERLANPHVGLVNVFAAPDAIRTTRARVVKDQEDLNAHYVMPLNSDGRREEGSPAMVADLEEFKKNWAIFTEGSLSQLVDWNNVVASGGSVLACLTPLEEENKKSKRAIRKFYHSKAYPTSDIDLFLWGLTPEQAEAKIKTIYEAVRDSVPWDVTCIRTKHTVSIHSQYPYRSVQIVLRLYQSPAEILAGFDIDAPCSAFDGEHVWANPRAVVAMMRQCNTVDMTRRSPSYEIRLAKYSRRAYEVYVPDLKRLEVDPSIFERAISRMEGLARLLVLEKLADDGMRTAFLQGRRLLRGRPDPTTNRYRRTKRKFQGDLKEELGMGIEMNDYDVASLHIPYGPGWDARRIDKLVYQTDLGMNSTFNPKNEGRRLHRHPAFFGTIEECLEDCCEHCPRPIDADERKLKEEEDEQYINGRIKFIQENPGRQRITGSFNPIDVGEWSEQVYIKPTQQLFTAIAVRDRDTVQRLLNEGIDVNQRDYVGRTTLHVAISAKATDIAGDLIDAGARITARLADGRAPLHLAAQCDEPTVIKKLFEQNAKNVAEQGSKDKDGDVSMDDEDGAARPSSADDWSSHDEEDVVISGPEDEEEDSDEEKEEDDDDEDEDGNKKSKKSKKGDADASPEESGDFPEEDKDQPDIIEVDAADWDLGFTALSYAVIYSSLETLNALIEAGADPKAPSKQTSLSIPLHPLTLTILRSDEDEACKIAERLLQLPSVTSSTADEDMQTILHKAVTAGRTKLVETLLRCDPHAVTVLNFPTFYYQSVKFPVTTAIERQHLAVFGVLLAYGAKLELIEQDVTTGIDALSPEKRKQATGYGSVRNYLNLVNQPVEVAVSMGNDIAHLLVALGASIDFGLKRALGQYTNPTDRRNLIDWVEYAVDQTTSAITNKTAELPNYTQDTRSETDDDDGETGWKAFHHNYLQSLKASGNKEPQHLNRYQAQTLRMKEQEITNLEDTKEFLTELKETLTSHKAKTWNATHTELSEAKLSLTTTNVPRSAMASAARLQEGWGYIYISHTHYDRQYVPEHLHERYDELYEACYAGDNDTVERLCLPVGGQKITIEQGVPPPLNISVRQIDPSITNWDANGYTPLFAAIIGRKWSTAKLILAIAVAQYAPDDNKDRIKFKLDIDMDEDGDSDGYDSDASDATVERQEIKFVDIATRPSAVKCSIHPKVMLQETKVPWIKKSADGLHRIGDCGLLAQSVVNGDLEAFVQTCKLYDALPQPLDIRASSVKLTILDHDQVDLMDEYIRRTGDGIDVEVAAKSAGNSEESEIPLAINDANKMYLGLNVNGKKRTDLASKNDPNATNALRPIVQPFVWVACHLQARKIVEYLASDRPLAAYTFYASTHSDPKAIWLRRMMGGQGKGVNNLEKKLPIWLGWTISSIGESPLTAAIAANDVKAIKLLARIQPSLTAQALQAKIKWAGASMINLAVGRGCDTKVIDYLLSRNVSATERLTSRGWNIYHQACSRKSNKLLEYLLRKLPRDVNEVLLTQQSKTRLNTPLHIAVNSGSISTVKILLEYSQSPLLLLNVDGQTPLHKAAEKSFAEITKMLLAAAPPSAIYIEDCVGHTLLEGAILRELQQRINQYRRDTIVRINNELQPSNYVISGKPLDLFLDNEQRITDMLTALETSGGKYRARVIATTAKWVAQREARIAELKARKARRDEEERDFKAKWDMPDVVRGIVDTEKTLAYIREAAEAATAMDIFPPRRLIHLFEVQQSVAATLSSARGENGREEEGDGDDDDYYRRRVRRGDTHGQLEEEEATEKYEKRASIVARWIDLGADRD